MVYESMKGTWQDRDNFLQLYLQSRTAQVYQCFETREEAKQQKHVDGDGGDGKSKKKGDDDSKSDEKMSVVASATRGVARETGKILTVGGANKVGVSVSDENQGKTVVEAAKEDVILVLELSLKEARKALAAVKGKAGKKERDALESVKAAEKMLAASKKAESKDRREDVDKNQVTALIEKIKTQLVTLEEKSG